MAKDKVTNLYNAFVKNGYAMEPEAQFRENLKDPKKRKAAYDALIADGYNMEPFADFENNIGFGTPVSTETPASAPALTPEQEQMPVQSAPEEPAQPAWRPSEQEKIRMSYQMHTMLNDFNQQSKARIEQLRHVAEPLTTEGRNKRAMKKFQTQLAGTPTRLMGLTPPISAPAPNGEQGEATEGTAQQPVQSGKSPVPYGVKYVGGKPVTQWLLPDGSLTADLMEADRAEHEARTARLRDEFTKRMKQNGLDPAKPDDVEMQAQFDAQAPAYDAVADLWREAEDKHKVDKERNAKKHWDSYAAMGGGREMRVVTASMNRHDDNISHMTRFDLEKMMDNAWNRVGSQITTNCYNRLRQQYPSASEKELQTTASKMARQLSDNAVYQYAVQKNTPKSVLEYFGRTVADVNVLNTISKGLARGQAGTSGDLAAYEAAMDEYGKNYRVAQVSGTVVGMAVDPVTWVSAGVGSAATKGAMWAGGRMLATKLGASTAVGTRIFGSSLGGRVVGGIAGGAGNFATYETIKEAENQFLHGGHINAESGENEGYSAGELLGATAHGLVLGSATGALSPLIGNVADKYVKATTSTAGKVGVRSAAFATSTLAEGTIFSVPQWINGEGDAFDVWTDNMAMMLGFKAQHGIKSAPRVIASLRPIKPTNGRPLTQAERNHNRMDFEERLRKALDPANPDNLTRVDDERVAQAMRFTADEREELRRAGYGELADLFSHDRVQEVQRPNINSAEGAGELRAERVEAETIHRSPEFDGYSAMEELMQDGRVSQAARAKVYYILTGRMLPMGTVTGYTTTTTEDGRVTVSATTADGEIVTSRTFKNEQESRQEVDNIMRQAEFNSIDVGERYKEAVADDMVLDAAISEVSPGADPDTIKRIYRAVKAGNKDVTESQVQLAEFLDDAIARNKDIADKYRSEAIREELMNETGIDVDAVLRKMPSKRTEAEQEAVKSYLERLFPEDARQQNAEPTPEQAEAQSQYEQGRLLYGRFEEGDPTVQADVDAIALRMQEAYQAVEDVFGAEAEYYMFHVNENPWVLVNDPELTAEQQDAVLYYINAKAALDGVMDASNEAAGRKRAEIEQSVDKRTHKDNGMVIPATMKVDDRQVYIVNGDVVMFPDGSAVDVRNSSESVVVMDAQTGEYEFASPDQIFKVSDAVNPQDELDTALSVIEQEQMSVFGENAVAPEESVENIKRKTFGEDKNYVNLQGEDGIYNEISERVPPTDDRAQDRENEPLSRLLEYLDSAGASATGRGGSTPSQGTSSGSGAPVPRQEVEARAAEAYSKESGLWIPMEDVYDLGRPGPSGNENDTYISPDNQYYYKVNNLMNSRGEISRLLKKVRLHNEVFPETRYEFVGMTGFDGRSVYPILRQRTVNNASNATPDEIAGYMSNLGFTRRGEYAWTNGIYEVSDLRPRNVLKDSDGDIYVIDAEIERKESALSHIPTNEEGEPMFESVDRETALDGLVEATGGNVDNASSIVLAQVDQLSADLDALKKKPPTKKAPKLKGSPMAMAKAQRDADEAYASAVEEYNTLLALIKQKLNAWTGISSLITSRKAEARAQREAEMAARQAKAHDEAVARFEEEQRIKAEKQAEQERIGVHAVNPKVRDKWDSAPKIEGHTDAITLPDGSTVRGRYVLTEAGAASASHDVNNAYMPTEGFPIDENGQSVNDRDYMRDKDAQRIVEQMAGAYDNRALQTPVIVSKDGVVLSGNNRTMSGDLASRQGTDKAYVDYLREFGHKYGFTPEQVQGMNNPRLVFVPEEDMPYDATTFSRFNAQEMKSQSKPEAAVKLGKIVPDNVFTDIVGDISRYDRLSDYYADEKAVAHALGALMQAGVINDKQMPEMRTGTALSAAGKELIENTLIGKVFQTSPDAVRQIISMPTLRQSIVMGLNEIANNRTLVKQGYDLSDELGKAVDLVTRAKYAMPDVYTDGIPVSPFGRMQGLFDDEFGDSTVTDAVVLQLADILNSGKPSDLRKWLVSYNNEAFQSASGQIDLFKGDIISKEEILNQVKEHFKNATPKEQQALVDAAIAERKRRAEAEAEQRGRDKEIEQTHDGSERNEEHQQSSAVADSELEPLGKDPNDWYEDTPEEAALRARISVGDEWEEAGSTSDKPIYKRKLYIDGKHEIIQTDAPDNNGSYTGSQLTYGGRDFGDLKEIADYIEGVAKAEPTEAQKAAGNYKMEHRRVDGHNISIENPKGSLRRGTGADGKPWETQMQNDYGYIRGTEGVDGDHIDVFLSDTPEEGDVFVVDQVNEDGSFDEHKVMYGFPTEQAAREAYLSNYEPGWTGLGAITHVSKEEFKKWIQSSKRKTKPFAEYKSVRTKEDNGMVGRSLSEPEATDLIAQMEANAEVAPAIELTPENWIAQFGEDGTVETPIGIVKMGENQFIKMFSRKRAEYFGMIRPTLNAPDVIIEKTAPAKDAERDTKYIFVKTFIKPDGSRLVHFESVTVQRDGMEVSVSSHEAVDKDIKKDMQKEKILHISEKLSLSSEWSLTETPKESEGPDLVPTSDNDSSNGKDDSLHPKAQVGKSVSLNDSNSPTNSDNGDALLGVNSSANISSDGKVNTLSAEKQTDETESLTKQNSRQIADNYHSGRGLPDTTENANFASKQVGGELKVASRYETQDGKTIRYTSENAEGYGVSASQGGNDDSRAGAGLLQRQRDSGLYRNNSILDADAGEFSVVERVFRESGAFNFTSGEKIESADDVAFIFSALEDAAKEHSFVVLVKDGKPTVVELGMGMFSQTMVDNPTAVLAYNRIQPEEVYFVHNHPSGNLMCSAPDVQCLRTFEKMFDVPVYGVIINLRTGKYGTFDTSSHSEVGQKRVPETELPLKVHTLDKQIFAPDYDPMVQPLVRGPQDVAQFLNSHRMGDRAKISFLILSRAGRIVGNIHTPFTEISEDVDSKARYISECVIQFGGESAILYGDFNMSHTNNVSFRALKAKMKEVGATNLSDIVSVEGNHTRSAYDEGVFHEPGSEYVSSDIRYRDVDDESIEEVNKRFNDELEQQIAGTLPEGHIYTIGKPGHILRAAGFPDATIELSSRQLAQKASQRNHEFEISDIRNLPQEIQTPIAIFRYGDNAKSENVIVGLTKEGKQFVVGVHFNQTRRGTEVSDIRGLFPKENAEWLNWISQGKAEWLDKEKIQALIDQQRTNLAEVEYLDLEDVAKIINSFENPTIKRNESYDSQFREVENGVVTDVSKFRDGTEMSDGERMRAIRGLEPINIERNELGRSELREIYNNLPAVEKDGREIEFYRSAFKKIYKEGGLFGQIVPQLDEILEQSVFAYSEGDILGSIVRPDGTVHKEHPNVDSFDNYVGKVEIEGREYYVRTTVQHSSKSSTRTHSFMVTQVDVYEKTADTLSLPITTRARGSAGGENSANGLSVPNFLSGESDNQRIVDAKLQQFFERASSEALELDKADRVRELSQRLDTPVRIMTEQSDIDNLPSTRHRRAKGFFDPATGEVVIVVPNNSDVADVDNTVVHEVVGHKGLRAFIGEECFDEFLGEVYEHASNPIRKVIDKKTDDMVNAEADRLRTRKTQARERAGEDVNSNYYADMAEARVEAEAKREDFRKEATEEYMSDLGGRIGSEGFEKMNRDELTLWGKIKAKVQSFLDKFLRGLKIAKSIRLNDKDLSYILFKSWKNMCEKKGKGGVFADAEDVVMHRRTGYDDTMLSESAKIEDANNRFNRELQRQIDGTLPDGHIYQLGHPGKILRSTGVPDLPIQLSATRLRIKATEYGHDFDVNEIRNLVKEMQTPIAVFEYGNKGKMQNIIVGIESNGKQFIVGLSLNPIVNGKALKINSVRNVFPKNNAEWLNWISQGKLLYADKQKIQALIDKQRTILADVDYLNLEDVAKIIKTFENPTFDGDEDVRFRDGADYVERVPVMARAMYEKQIQSSMYQFTEAMQDSMLGLMEFYKAVESQGAKRDIENVASIENAYIAENLMSSKSHAEMDEYEHRIMRPLLDIAARMSVNKRGREELIDYMMAKHGLERNAYMRNEAMANGEESERDFAGLCGLTGEQDWQNAEAAARQIVDDYEAAHSADIAEFWGAVNKATKTSLKKVYDCGLLSKEQYEKILDMYKYYIPLRGFDEKTSNDVYGYLTSKYGSFSSPIKKAEGRRSKADDPLATIAYMAQNSIIQGNRNVMKQKFLTYVQNHPSDLASVNRLWLVHDETTDTWKPAFAEMNENMSGDEIDNAVMNFEQHMESLSKSEPDKYKRGKDAISIPYRLVDGNIKEHQVLVKRNGESYVVTINGNPRAAQAVNGLTNPDNDLNGAIGKVFNLVGTVNRQLSQFYTIRSPDFVVSNFIRDLIYSNTMVHVKENQGYAMRFHKNHAKVNPIRMVRLLQLYEANKLDMHNPMHRMLYEFMHWGGETGYTMQRDLDQEKKLVAKIIKDARRSTLSPISILNLIGHKLDQMNRGVENSARFAAFITSRESGRDVQRSVYDAKEISVNFNKKGAGSKFMDATGQTKVGKVAGFTSGLGKSFYVFWNAAVQGTANGGKPFRKHPSKAIMATTALMLLGYVMAALMDDNDDEDKNGYYNIPKYTRRSNLMFRTGDQWLTIPLPVEYRALYGLGELAYSVTSGREEYSDMELAKETAAQLSQILPLDFMEGGGGLHAFVPSAFKPLVESATNTSWTGLPIYKDTPFNKDMPDWTKAYPRTNAQLIDLSKWANEISGGNEYKQGWANFNPAQLEYLLNGYFGGYSNVINKMVKTGETMLGERDYDPSSILLVNRLVKMGDERTAEKKINSDFFKYLEEYNHTHTLLRQYEDEAERGSDKYRIFLDALKHSRDGARHDVMDEYISDYRWLNKAIKDPEITDNERTIYEADMRKLKRKVVSLMKVAHDSVQVNRLREQFAEEYTQQ